MITTRVEQLIEVLEPQRVIYCDVHSLVTEHKLTRLSKIWPMLIPCTGKSIR
jgi:hypothetical protein